MVKKKNANRPMTQEEIWDDSALVQSWNEAVEEYKLYHSIHAKGENIEDVLREAEAAEHAAMDHDEQQPDADADIVADVEAPVVDPLATPTTGAPTIDASQATNEAKPPAAPMGAGMAHAALAQVQDEGLKNMMMAWYFAGYYTGLYEGQQRANESKGP